MRPMVMIEFINREIIDVSLVLSDESSEMSRAIVPDIYSSR